MTQTPPPAGWYPQGDQERWWNGNGWSDNVRPLGSDTSGGYPPMFQAGPQQPQQPQQPYGQQPYGQPPYGQPGAQPGYYAAPVQKSHLARNLLITFAVLFVVLVGGCVAGIAVLASRVDEVVNDDTPGGPNNPLEITEGQSFEVAGFEYAGGWSIGPDEVGDTDVVGLQVTNDREDSDYAFVTIKLLDINTVVATVSCTAAGDQIAPGTTVDLDCTSTDDLPATWDTVTIQDAF